MSAHQSHELPEHYRRFPCMKPWKGPRYEHPRHKKLLVIGESHYLPQTSTLHRDLRWYSADENQLGLVQDNDGHWYEERGWICPNAIIGVDLKRDPTNRAFIIYREVAFEVNDFLGRPHSDYLDAVHDIAFYNYFQRPALARKGLRVEQQDRDVAAEVLKWNVCDLKPDVIIVASIKAWGNGAAQTLRQVDGPICFRDVPHPARSGWDKRLGRYDEETGRERFRQILMDCGFRKKSEEERNGQ